jgi:BolA protein
MTQARVEAIRARIEAALSPLAIEVTDESNLHVGHEGARDGRGHFRVRVVSQRFVGLRPIERHRLVYAAVGALMLTDVHALAVTALTSEEAAGRS